MKNLSLRVKLIILISATVFVAWLVASAVAFWQIRDNLEELFDSQQILFAKRLASFNLQNIAVEKKAAQLPPLKSKVLKKLNFDDDALAFAIFDLNGRMLLNDGEEGQAFRFNSGILSSPEKALLANTDEWRILWLWSFDNRFIVAVGQELDYRQEISHELIVGQMIPWLIVLPILMLTIIAVVNRELKPLNAIAAKLLARRPDDETLIENAGAPKEVQPFVNALNALFLRISGMLIKERRFISDAAHELRTPLAALKVQAEVIQLSDDDPQARQNAVGNLISGTDRATHLVDQLLILSRLDSYSTLPGVEKVNWQALIDSVIKEQSYSMERRNVTISFSKKGRDFDYCGNALLLSLLVRNVFDNALRYTPEGSRIYVILEHNKLTIEDNGDGVEQNVLERLGERFFRPPGQDEIGSGLGLSIVKQIADFHRMTVRFYNRKQRGFGIALSWET